MLWLDIYTLCRLSNFQLSKIFLTYGEYCEVFPLYSWEMADALVSEIIFRRQMSYSHFLNLLMIHRWA